MIGKRVSHAVAGVARSGSPQLPRPATQTPPTMLGSGLTLYDDGSRTFAIAVSDFQFASSP
jgi:hypothetical protein